MEQKPSTKITTPAGLLYSLHYTRAKVFKYRTVVHRLERTRQSQSAKEDIFPEISGLRQFS